MYKVIVSVAPPERDMAVRIRLHPSAVHWSSGQRRCPLEAESRGSNPRWTIGRMWPHSIGEGAYKGDEGVQILQSHLRRWLSNLVRSSASKAGSCWFQQECRFESYPRRLVCANGLMAWSLQKVRNVTRVGGPYRENRSELSRR